MKESTRAYIYRVLRALQPIGVAYGLEVRGLQGISTASEAGAADVQALAEYITERQIPAIFIESSVNEATIDAVKEAVRSRGFDGRQNLGSDGVVDVLAGSFSLRAHDAVLLEQRQEAEIFSTDLSVQTIPNVLFLFYVKTMLSPSNAITF